MWNLSYYQVSALSDYTFSTIIAPVILLASPMLTDYWLGKFNQSIPAPCPCDMCFAWRKIERTGGHNVPMSHASLKSRAYKLCGGMGGGSLVENSSPDPLLIIIMLPSNMPSFEAISNNGLGILLFLSSLYPNMDQSICMMNMLFTLFDPDVLHLGNEHLYKNLI